MAANASFLVIPGPRQNEMRCRHDIFAGGSVTPRDSLAEGDVIKYWTLAELGDRAEIKLLVAHDAFTFDQASTSAN